MANLLSLEDIRAAATTISGHVERTPTVASPGMSAFLGVPVTLKLELLQRSGSFKPRGVATKLLGLTPVERDAGVVAVSGGNHGIAVAEVASGMGVRATVVMAKTAPPRSIDRIRAAGADPGIADRDGVTALEHARERGYDEIAQTLEGAGGAAVA